MAYRVLARKYRPLNFEALVGQEHVVQALANALTQQRLHHAYLFTGTRGVGKTTVSRILAKSLNCVGPGGDGGITATPCGQCQVCTDIDSGRFVDYIELDAASNRGVEEISQLLDQAVYKPVIGRFKVYMIDEVHMLSTTAFNAMLKTLEEPPDYLKFVLATTDPQKVPPTVLSRCLQFNLRPMPPQTVQAHLVDLLAQEDIPAEPGALRLLARAARGSMRDALSLTDQAIAFGAGSLSETGVRDMLGAVDSGHAVRIVLAIVQGDGADLVAAADGVRNLGLSAAGTLEEVASLLQHVAVLQAVPEATLDSDIDAATLGQFASQLAADELQVLYSIAVRGRGDLGLAPDEYSGLVMVLLRMLAFAPSSQAGGRVDPPRAVSGRAPVAPAAASKPEHAASTRPQPPGPPPVEGAVPQASNLAPPRPAPREPARPAVVAPQVASRAVQVPEKQQPVVADSPAWAPWDEAPWPGDDDRGAADDARATSVGMNDLPSEFGAAKRRSAAEPEARSQEPPAPGEPEATELVTTELGTLWAQTVGQLVGSGRISALVRELAMQAQCVQADLAQDPAIWQLRVEREMLRSTALCDKLQAALADQLGRQIKLELLPGTAQDSPALRDSAERRRKQAQAEQIIHDDPQVQALLAQFKTARIVPGSVKPH